jgi:transcriptional regulator with XRE-family HTH domain
VAGAEPTKQAEFGELLRRYRVSAGLTQEELAVRSALSARGISELERSARTHPYPSTVRRLAEALGLPDAEWLALQTAAELSHRVQAGRNATVSTQRGLLPTPLSSFVGREREVNEVRRLLATDRLLTLLGPAASARHAWRSRSLPAWSIDSRTEWSLSRSRA